MDAFTIIGDPALNRVQFFAAAVRAVHGSVEIVSYRDILEGKIDRHAQIAGRRVRLESPGRDFEVERGLLARGARAGVEPDFAQLPLERIETLTRDPGLVLATRPWYLGYADLLREVAEAGAQTGATFLNAPADIVTMFDKPASHARLAAAGVPVPAAQRPPRSFDDLVSALNTAGWSRAFLKTSHGSGANGVVALECNGRAIHATTALELDDSQETPALYATTRLRTYRDEARIRRLVDALCRERLHVESWVPKAGLAGKTFDVRVVVIGGRACHLLLRLASGPITNLHLNAEKGSEELLAQHAGRDAVALLRATAEKAAACFPRSLCIGVDITLTPSFQRAYVLEVNAFGDLLEGVLWRGADTYTWAVRAALNRDWPPC